MTDVQRTGKKMKSVRDNRAGGGGDRMKKEVWLWKRKVKVKGSGGHVGGVKEKPEEKEGRKMEKEGGEKQEGRKGEIVIWEELKVKDRKKGGKKKDKKSNKKWS